MKLNLFMYSKSLKDFPFYSPIHLPDYFWENISNKLMIFRSDRKKQQNSTVWWKKVIFANNTGEEGGGDRHSFAR